MVDRALTAKMVLRRMVLMALAAAATGTFRGHLRASALQREMALIGEEHTLVEVTDALRYLVDSGFAERQDLPPALADDRDPSCRITARGQRQNDGLETRDAGIA